MAAQEPLEPAPDLVPPPSVRDPDRLAALRATALLDSPADESFDRLTRLAARVLGTATALVSLVDEDRQFFKCAVGLGEPWRSRRETPLEYSFCMYAVESGEPLVVADARKHPVLAGSPAVNELGCVAYAGVPLVTEDGHALGTLCVFQPEARDWRPEEIEILEELAAATMTSIELVAEIRARRSLDEKLRDARERLEWTLELSPAVVYVLALRDDGPAPTWVSANIRRLLGYEPASTLDPDWWGSNVHPRDRDVALEAVGKLSEEESLTHRYRFRKANGEFRWIRDELRLVPGEGGEPDRAVGAWIDITDRMEAEDALREAFLRSHIERASEMITVLDERGRILYESPSVERVLGRDPESMIGRDVFEFLHPDDRERIVERFGEFLDRPHEAEIVEFRFRHADGSWRLLKGIGNNLLDDPDVRGVVFNSRDITEERALEEQLRQAQKMEALGSLAGSVAHDFNNVLAAIGGHVALLAADVGEDDALQRDLAEIGDAAERGASLTRQLLSFSRKEPTEVRPLSLNETVGRIEPMLRRLLGSGVDLQLALEASPDRVMADAGQVDQILMNLVGNARDAMPDGGTVALRTGRAPLDPELAGLSGLGPGPQVHLEVEDTGQGMPPEVLEKIFDPFFTTKEEGKGTGLGLATVYRIVQQRGGWVTVASEVGKGSRFRIFLPEASGGSGG